MLLLEENNNNLFWNKHTLAPLQLRLRPQETGSVFWEKWQYERKSTRTAYKKKEASSFPDTA